MMATSTNVTESENVVRCYLCNQTLNKDDSVLVPLTTGDNVHTHRQCLDLYLQQATAGDACGGCSGDKGCCG